VKHRRIADNRSANWALFERPIRIPDYDDPSKVYLTRWRLISTPWFAIFVHRLDGPDPRATPHDHPWSFRSFVLRGGYIERRLDPLTMEIDEARVVRRMNHIHAGEAHSIRRLLRAPTWTIVFVGSRRRTWGYWENCIIGKLVVMPGWLWTEFDQHPYNEEFKQAMARHKELVG
jgi:hypothetical protein